MYILPRLLNLCNHSHATFDLYTLPYENGLSPLIAGERVKALTSYSNIDMKK